MMTRNIVKSFFLRNPFSFFHTLKSGESKHKGKKKRESERKKKNTKLEQFIEKIEQVRNQQFLDNRNRNHQILMPAAIDSAEREHNNNKQLLQKEKADKI